MSTMTYGDKRVLVVEDQRPFLIMLRGLVNSLGAKSVVTAQNGEAGIAACRKEKFDIIIADLHLGAGKKNGFQFIEEVRQRKLIKPTTICIIISADSDRPIVLGSLEKEPDGYLVKPFSQAQLNLRLVKAFQKKTELAPVYTQIMKGDDPAAIEACRELIKAGTRHRQACTHLLAELYWRTGMYQQAEHMLKPLLMHKPLLWVMLAMARTQYLLEHYPKATSLAQKAITTSKFSVEGYDILAKSYFAQDMLLDAQAAIDRALDLSPLSIERQFTGCEIARANENFEMVKNCSQAIWEQTKRSIHRDIAHFCTFIRSILDAAEHAEEKKDRNKFQQEALIALQRSRHDDALARIDELFDHNIFEEMINARVNFLDGKLLESKRFLSSSQSTIEQKYDEYPLYLAPDSIKVMFDLGEFEDALELADMYQKSEHNVDANTQALLTSELDKGKRNQELYQKHNKQGMDLYKEGKYEAAHKEFKKAQVFSPVNTGVALNLLQCLLKLLDMRDKPDVDMLRDVRQTYKLVDGMPLKEVHQRKLDSLRTDLENYIR